MNGFVAELGYQARGWQLFPVKGLMVSITGSVGHTVFFGIVHLCCKSVKVAIDNMWVWPELSNP